MSLLFMDSYQWLVAGTTDTTLENFLSEKYVVANMDAGFSQKGIILVAPGGSQSLRFGESTSDFIVIPVSGAPITFIIGFRCFTGGHPTNSSVDFIRIRDSSNVEQFSVNLDDNLTVLVKRGSTNLKTISVPSFTLGEWHHFEMKATVGNGTAGAIEIRLNEKTIIDISNIDNSNSGTPECDNLVIFQPIIGLSSGWQIRDLYVLDDAGSTNNDFLGQDKVTRLLLPDADGDDEDWTLSAGADSFDLLDDVNHDSDGTYIESSTSTNQTLLNLEATASELNILAIIVASTVRLDSAGSESYQHVVKHSASETDSVSIVVTNTTYEQFFSVFEVNPSTSLAWTASELDVAQAGVEYQ